MVKMATIGILSRQPHLYSTRRLWVAVEQQGHQPVLVNALQVVEYLRGGQDVPPVIDGLIARVGGSMTRQGIKAMQYYENQGVVVTAGSAGIACSRDKFKSYQRWQEMGLPVPATILVQHTWEWSAAVQQLGGLPVVAKQRRGTQGEGVLLVSDPDVAELLLAHWQPPPFGVLLQPFLAEAQGKDVRVIVVGNRCVAAMEREAAIGDFRANLHRGGRARGLVLDERISQLAVQGAQAVGLAVAGIDLIFSRQGFLLLEANSSPGLEGIEGATGADVARAIVDYLTEQLA